jgi:hypothetical protein
MIYVFPLPEIYFYSLYQRTISSLFIYLSEFSAISYLEYGPSGTINGREFL